MKIKAMVSVGLLVSSALAAASPTAHAAIPEYCNTNVKLEFRVFGVDNPVGSGSYPDEVPYDGQPGAPGIDTSTVVCNELLQYNPLNRDLRLIPYGATQVRATVYAYDPGLSSIGLTLYAGSLFPTTTVTASLQDDQRYVTRWIELIRPARNGDRMRAEGDGRVSDSTCYQTLDVTLGSTGPCTIN